MSAVGPVRVRVRGAVVELVCETRFERRVLLDLTAGRVRADAQAGGADFGEAVIDDHFVSRGERLFVLESFIVVAGATWSRAGVAGEEAVAIPSGGNEPAGVVTTIPPELRERRAFGTDVRTAIDGEDARAVAGAVDAQLPEREAKPALPGGALIREDREQPHRAELAGVRRRELVRACADRGDEVGIAIVVLGSANEHRGNQEERHQESVAKQPHQLPPEYGY